MAGRLISDKERSWLLAELDQWQTAGAIGPEQAERILVPLRNPRRSQRAETLTSGLHPILRGGLSGRPRGAALDRLQLGRFAADRQARPDLWRADWRPGDPAFFVRYRWRFETASEILFFCGCLLYGAAIWLVAQVFHLDRIPGWRLVVGLGVLPFALCLDTLLLHVLLVGLLALWAGMEVVGFPHLGAWLFGRWGFIPNGAYSLPLLALPGLIWAYRKRSPMTVSLYVPLLAWWIILQPIAWRLEASRCFLHRHVRSGPAHSGRMSPDRQSVCDSLPRVWCAACGRDSLAAQFL